MKVYFCTNLKLKDRDINGGGIVIEIRSIHPGLT